jgi:hypothetical protein
LLQERKKKEKRDTEHHNHYKEEHCGNSKELLKKSHIASKLLNLQRKAKKVGIKLKKKLIEG